MWLLVTLWKHISVRMRSDASSCRRSCGLGLLSPVCQTTHLSGMGVFCEALGRWRKVSYASQRSRLRARTKENPQVRFLRGQEAPLPPRWLSSHRLITRFPLVKLRVSQHGAATSKPRTELLVSSSRRASDLRPNVQTSTFQ